MQDWLGNKYRMKGKKTKNCLREEGRILSLLTIMEIEHRKEIERQ